MLLSCMIIDRYCIFTIFLIAWEYREVYQMRNKKYLLYSVLSLFLFIFMISGVSYAYFVYNKDVTNVALTSGSINIDFSKTANTSSVVSTQSLNDNLGIISPNYLEFTVTGTADIEAIKYEIEVIPSNGNTLEGRYVKVYLTEYDETNDTETVLASPCLYTELYNSMANNGKGIYQDLITGNNDGTSKNYEKKYRLRAWVDENYKGTSDNIENIFTYGIYLYAENVDAANYHRLTFDFGDSKILSKMVAIGEDYGSLPTPYKEGYNFLGWNGKNKFNEEKYLNMNDYPFHNNSSNYSYSKIILNSNTNYKISVIRYNDFDGTTTDLFISNYTSINNDYSAIAHINTPDSSLVDFKYTTSMDGLLYIGYATAWTIQSDLNRIWTNTDVQLEEGSAATPYEPYYVTSDTEVTRWNNDMVLTAKYSWSNYRYNDEVQTISSQDIHGGEMHDDYITLNGSSDYIDVGQVTDKKEVSIQATIKAEESDLTGEHEIISNDETSGMELDIKDSYVRFSLYLDGYNHYVRMVSSSIIDTASVHDIVGTYDGREMKLYIDGILDNSSFYVDNTLNTTNTLSDIISTNNLTGKIKDSNNNTVMAIGGNPSSSTVTGNYFAGNIYSVRIYDYAIDELKIKTNIRKDGFLAKYNS